MKSPPRVALLIETSNAYARGLLRGIRAFLRERDSWSIYLGEHRRGEPAPQWLTRWTGDGVIARIETPAIARVIEKLNIPTVDVSAARHLPNIPFVETDDDEIALAAFNYLRGRGLKHFAFCGDERFRWSKNREEAFRRTVGNAGYPCSIHSEKSPVAGEPHWERRSRSLASWIETLPRPVGILTAYDILGRQVLDACRDAIVQVPDQAAVIGVDNDELLCDFASPSLTSVEPDAVRTGFEAAVVLSSLMKGYTVSQQATLIKPLGIVTRGSTDVLAIDDPEVARAMRFIRDHALQGIHVSDILEAVPLSRRLLESRFRSLLGRTPHEEIERVRLERVKQLLADTDLSLAAIARRCSYRHMEYMCVAFKRVVGKPPGQYRLEHRQ